MRFSHIRARALVFALSLAGAACATTHASAEAFLLIEADTGKVLFAENATYPWYPASVTKLMTTYVALRAVKEGRITFDKLLTVSDVAAAQQPSKMGFKPGTQVTLDNALKMLMVKSANDMAVVIAEGVSGSVEKFATEMNQSAQRLGMTQTSYVNPNGLPADQQITSARDLAILARALMHEFPQWDFYWHIPAIKYGSRVWRNFNKLIGRYPGADGMKTGFICASGFNLVASATRNGRRLIAIVLGAPSSAVRAEQAARLLEKGFTVNPLSWLMPSLGYVNNLTPIAAAPPDLRDEICGSHRKKPAADSDDDETVSVDSSDPRHAYAIASADLRGLKDKKVSLLGAYVMPGEPIPVFVGPANKPSIVAIDAPKRKSKIKRAKVHRKTKRQTVTVSTSTTQDTKADKPAATKKPAKKAARPHRPAKKPHNPRAALQTGPKSPQPN